MLDEIRRSVMGGPFSFFWFTGGGVRCLSGSRRQCPGFESFRSTLTFWYGICSRHADLRIYRLSCFGRQVKEV